MEYTLTYNHQSQFVEMFGSIDDNKYNLPIKKIGDFATCFAGATPSTSNPEYWDNGTIRWMSSGEVHKVHIEDAENRITELGYKSASTKMVPIHSIVIALAGQGKTRGTVAITEVDLCTNQSLCAIVPNDQVNYIYLYQNLHGRYSEIRGLSGDVNGRGGLNLKIIQQIPVIIPPMEKQEEFASIVRQADKSKFDGFKSQFIEQFCCDNCELMSLEEISVSKGEYGANTSAIPYEEGSPRYIRITDINEDGSLNDDKMSAENVEDKYLLEDGDLLFARTGATVGKTYCHKDGYAMYAGYLIRYKLNPKIALPEYVSVFTHTDIYWEWIRKSLKVGAQPNISAQQYNLLRIPIPSLEKQNSFLSIVRQADKSKFELKKAIEAIDQVIKSLING